MSDIIFPAIITVVTSVTGSVISYQLIDVGRKRKVETYWKIEDEYKSDGQTKARKEIEHIKEEFATLLGRPDFERINKAELKMLVDYYNNEYHLSHDQNKRDIAWCIRTRLRFLNQIGILLRKRMVSKELTFSLIGLGFQIDYSTLRVILTAHRESHNTPRLYNQFEYLWNVFLRWRNRN